ncbi:MAG: Hsp70 family protein [Alphaproteobacteria bacterium]|nr:Hsp70 family protein [Alphaproteobacteria bacterium]MCB9792215.1 Hsp70 family protein [Alphaproteobacteria bacterium]
MRSYGIDLGTSFSGLACARDDGVFMVPARGGGGQVLTPSLVCFDGSGRAHVGEAALLARDMAEDPEQVRFFDFFKRDIGVERELGGRYADPIEGVGWDPVCLSTLVLRKLRMDAEAAGQSLSSAVVAHPHHFFVPQKNATRRAAVLAGISEVRTVSEPVAAAIDQGFGRSAVEGVVMVFDLGGGTLDVSLVEVGPGKLKVVGGQGDPRLGGKDFDDVVMRIFQEAMHAEHQLGWEDGDALERAEWRSLAREAKEDLQRRPRVRVNLSAQGCALRMTLGRQTFEESCFALVNRIEDTAEGSLRLAGLRWADLDRVVMVGGSSRLRLVQAWLKERAGDKVVLADQPDLAVARGAALLARQLDQGKAIELEDLPDHPDAIETSANEESELSLDVTSQLPRGVGVLYFDRARNEKRPHVIVPAHTPLPAQSAPQPFRTTREGARRIRVEVAEVPPEAPQDWVKIGDCVIDELPEGLPRGTRVEVTLELDLGGGLEVTAFCPLVGKRVTAQLSLGELPESEAPAAAGACDAKAAAIPLVVDA